MAWSEGRVRRYHYTGQIDTLSHLLFTSLRELLAPSPAVPVRPPETFSCFLYYALTRAVSRVSSQLRPGLIRSLSGPLHLRHLLLRWWRVIHIQEVKRAALRASAPKRRARTAASRRFGIGSLFIGSLRRTSACPPASYAPSVAPAQHPFAVKSIKTQDIRGTYAGFHTRDPVAHGVQARLRGVRLNHDL